MSPAGTPTERYSIPARWLHWLIALAIFANFGLGWYMHELPLSPRKLELYSYHKWLGITALLLVIIRLCWRLVRRPPPLAAHLARWETALAHATHHLLYVAMLAVPLSGWLMSSALGFSVVWFGLLPLPDLIGANQAWGERLTEVHETLAYAMLALIALHVAGALKHHFIDRDDTLVRMLPALRSLLKRDV